MAVPNSGTEECGICLDMITAGMLRTTTCCRKYICHHCAASVNVYKSVPTCPYCRHAGYNVEKLDGASGQPKHLEEGLSSTPPRLAGTWDVKITESSKIGSSTYDVVLTIDGDSAHYKTDDTHFKGGCWSELTFGHTQSGKSFVARQQMADVPAWMSGATVMGSSGLQGRLNGLDSANFTSSVIIEDARGDEELEITQKAVMVRRQEKPTCSL